MVRDEARQTKISRPCPTEENMQKLSSLLFTTLIGVAFVALAHESRAQTSAAP